MSLCDFPGEEVKKFEGNIGDYIQKKPTYSCDRDACVPYCLRCEIL